MTLPAPLSRSVRILIRMRIELFPSRPTVSLPSPLRDQLAAHGFQGVVVLAYDLPGLHLQGGDVGATGVVHVILAYVEQCLEAVVAPGVALGGEKLPQLIVDRVGHPVEDDVQDRLGPQREPPTLDLLVGQAAGQLSGAQRDYEEVVLLGVDLPRLDVCAHGRVVGVDPAVYEGAVALVANRHLEGLEVGGRGGGRPRDIPHEKIVSFLIWVPRVPALEEPGDAALYLIGADGDLRERLRKAAIFEVLARDVFDALRGVLLLRQVPHGVYAVPHRAVEDLPTLGFVELDQPLGAVLGLAVSPRLG